MNPKVIWIAKSMIFAIQVLYTIIPQPNLFLIKPIMGNLAYSIPAGMKYFH